MERIPKIVGPELEVRDLRLVLALRASGSTASAARALCLTQPAVSRALLSLEERLATRLFERTPRGLSATEAGERLVTVAGQLLTSLREAESWVRAPAVPPRRVRIVCECYTAYHWLPSVLTALREADPSIVVELATQHTDTPAEALADGAIDVALLTAARVRSDAVTERALFADEVVFALSPKHELAQKRVLTPGDLHKTVLWTGNIRRAESNWFIRSVFGRARPRLRVERLPLTEAILDMARARLGVAVLSEWVARPQLGRGDLVVRRLARGPLLRPWRFAYRRELGDELALRLQQALSAAAPRAALEG
jgi:LysR family transcriptional regulator, regulator for metE and metH